MNHKAIDAGATAFKKFDVPADWADAQDSADTTVLSGKPKLVEQVKNHSLPRGQDGWRQPACVRLCQARGRPVRAWCRRLRKARRGGVPSPTWDSTKCIQCNNCAYVCPHATIRPYALTAEEAKNAPASAKIVDVKAGKGKGIYQYTMAISPLDCMGCGVCVGQCPVGALTMVPPGAGGRPAGGLQLLCGQGQRKTDMQDDTVKGSQFRQPMLEFSGSCAGCAETSYARLVTQLFGDRMYISNATGCSSIWGGPAATSPYCTNKAGHGPPGPTPSLRTMPSTASVLSGPEGHPGAAC